MPSTSDRVFLHVEKSRKDCLLRQANHTHFIRNATLWNILEFNCYMLNQAWARVDNRIIVPAVIPCPYEKTT